VLTWILLVAVLVMVVRGIYLVSTAELPDIVDVQQDIGE
jgi:hypothetical protein